jgi:hypothetical protein
MRFLMFKKVLTSTRGYGRREEMKNDEEAWSDYGGDRELWKYDEP